MGKRQTPEEMRAIIRANTPDARLRQIEEYIATLPADLPERAEIERRLPLAWQLVEDDKPGETTARMVELETLQRLVERAAARMWARANKPDMDRGRQFPRGSQPGRRGPLKRWLHEYLDRHPGAGIREVWYALRLDPTVEESSVAGCIVFAGKKQSRENVKKKLSEARQERNRQDES